MAENGILNNIGVSKRSGIIITAMFMLMKLSDSDGKYVLPVIGGIVILGVFYMVMNEIKDRRNGDKNN